MRRSRLLAGMSLVLSVFMALTLVPANALEVRGVTNEVLAEVFAEYGEDVEVRPLESIAVYVNPYNSEVFYEVPVYRNKVIVGSFSVTEQGTLRKTTQSVHLVDFSKVKSVETYISRIESLESATVKEWRYVFMRDMYTSALIYSLDNGNTGVYVLTSRVLKKDVCLSVSDWEYQVEYFTQVQWDESDLQYINSPFGEVEMVLLLALLFVFVCLIWAVIHGEMTRKEAKKAEAAKQKK